MKLIIANESGEMNLVVLEDKTIVEILEELNTSGTHSEERLLEILFAIRILTAHELPEDVEILAVGNDDHPLLGVDESA